MANPEHLSILKQGVEAWNQWRRENPLIRPDISEADLRRLRVRGKTFSGEELRGREELTDIVFGGGVAEQQIRGPYLRGANFRKADLSGAILPAADLSDADLRETDLPGAKLCKAHLTRANLSRANLKATDLQNADLRWVGISGAEMHRTDISEAIVGWTTFGDVDLSEVNGLATVRHEGPSIVGIDTIYKSKGQIPDRFLRGAGVPEPFIANMKALVAAIDPIQFYSCFISYSTKDQKFAERLHADLESHRVRCWFAPKDLEVGGRTRVLIDESIRVHDKLLLILSKHSVQSAWVEQEVETALANERQQKRTVLFPIRLDQAAMMIDTGWPALIRNSRNIGDFRRWKNHDSYQTAFARLLRDLKTERSRML